MPLGGEDALVDWLKQRAAGTGGERIGDDCALLPAAGPLAVTVDTQIAGVHFVEGWDPAWIARRLLAVNLSDLAAVGAEPAQAFLALSAPADFDHRRFFDGLLAACRPLGLDLAGGDLSTQPRTTAALTLIGHRQGRRFVERSTALPGQRLWLAGPVGESALGLRLVLLGARPARRGFALPIEPGTAQRATARAVGPGLRTAARRALRAHLAPRPQLEVGRWLASLDRGAAIDISDGLAKDLHRLCRASGVSAEINLDRLGPAPGMRELARSLASPSREGADPALDAALFGGEDYALLFTLDPALEPPAQLRRRFRCRSIGQILDAGPGGSEVWGIRNLDRAGRRREKIPDAGFDHLKGPG